MTTVDATARVGCSGWSYKDWRGPVYPAQLPQRCWFEHYQGLFVNRTRSIFYVPPGLAIRNSLLFASAPVALAVGTVEAVKPRIDSPLHADLSIRPYFQKAQLDTVYVLVVLPESGH